MTQSTASPAPQRIAILPFRGADRRTLAALVEDLARHGLHAALMAEFDVPPAAYDPARGQYRARALLTVCVRAAETTRVLGVTGHDLYADDLNFVFGLAQMPGRAAVISLARLRHGADVRRFRTRVLKEAVHELGHTFGLEHCADPACVMHFSNMLMDTDRKGSEFCPACRARIAD